jgi:hypothetical protein
MLFKRKGGKGTNQYKIKGVAKPRNEKLRVRQDMEDDFVEPRHFPYKIEDIEHETARESMDEWFEASEADNDRLNRANKWVEIANRIIQNPQYKNI